MASLWKLLAACVIRNTITKGASVTRASPRSSCSGGILGESPGVGFACNEPPRVCRRPYSLRDRGHEQEADTEVFA